LLNFMAIVVEAFTVIVRNATLAARYPGGVDGLGRDCPNATFCSDDHLSRIAFMVREDADAFMAQMAAKGLTPSLKQAAADVVLVTSSGGASLPCTWLELGTSGKTSIAWLSGTPPGEIRGPAGWDPNAAPLRFISPEEMKERFEFVRTQGNVDVYRDKQTGKELFTGRTRPVADEARHNELYEQATGLVQGLIHIHGQTPAVVTPERRQRLDKAIALFKEVIDINPGNWAAMWLLGKVYQALGDYPKGLEWFSRAHRTNPDQPDVAREAAIAAMDSGRPAEAIAFCRRAIEASPTDPGLRANLALALLFSGQPSEALSIAEEALRRVPSDPITAKIVAVIKQVVSGSEKCPHTMQEMQRLAARGRKPWWMFWK
jgi:tetratricopeptide (TPR) repeat protein